MDNLKRFVSALMFGSSVFSAAATAAPMVYFGENLNAGGTVLGAPVTARTNFLNGLANIFNADFENFVGEEMSVLSLELKDSTGNSITGTMEGAGLVEKVNKGGLFNTTVNGAKYWNKVTGPLFITFSRPISAFGFYGTDLSAVNTMVSLIRVGGDELSITVPNTTRGKDGSLLFFGVIDPTQSFIGVSFHGFDSDGYGLDDMVVGDSRPVVAPVPEPGSAALLAIALMGMGAAWRRKELL